MKARRAKTSRKGAEPKRGQRRHDWTALEAAFLATVHGDLTRFAKEVEVPFHTLARKAAALGWRARWDEVQKAALERAQATVVEDRAQQIATMNREHYADAAELRGAVMGMVRTKIAGGCLLMHPIAAKAVAETLGKLQAQQRIALGVPTEKQGREVSGPDGAPVPVQMQTLSIHVVQARESPEPPSAPEDPDDRDDS